MEHVALGTFALGFAVGMSISCCLCTIFPHLVKFAVYGGIWALQDPSTHMFVGKMLG